MADETVETPVESGGFWTSIILEIVQSPINILLVIVIAFLVYKIIKSRHPVDSGAYNKGWVEPTYPRMRKDFRIEELAQYDGRGPCRRVFVAVNGNVYNVSKGRRFYGPGGPYAAFGGKDASRGLATFSVNEARNEYDDLSDLNSMEMESIREWEEQFKEKYELVGRLLKPGEEPRSYSDEEDESVDTVTDPVTEKSKDD